MNSDLNLAKIIGVAGGSCSGKTLLVDRLSKELGPDNAVVIEQDSYYFGRRSFGKITENFDHPNALDFGMLRAHLEALSAGNFVHAPVYDFKTHARTKETTLIEPKRVVIVEGTLILASAELEGIFDRTFYIECDESVRKQRRLERDVRSRGRTVDSVDQQFQNYVSPMHKEFVSPSKQHAQCILNQEMCNSEITGESTTLLDYCLAHLSKRSS